MRSDAALRLYEEQLYGQHDVKPGEVRRRFWPRQCCDVHRKEDAATPLLFKEEFSGISWLGLGSKMVHARGEEDGGQDKLACKGLQRSRLSNAYDTFRDVLRGEGCVGGGENISF